MSGPIGTRVDRAAEWVYRGVWRVLVDLFRVPATGPSLPAGAGEAVEQFHPARGFLSWLKFYFWLVLVLIDGALVVGWIALCVQETFLALILAPVFLVVIVVPDVLAYVAIHLRYDTTWYVLSERSLRIRRGIWAINEVSITFENVQNVKVSQGPLQRAFGIASVLVETAGSHAGSGQPGAGVTNQGLIEGVSDAPGIRDRIMERVRRSRTAGLGDERDGRPAPSWSPAHLELLREVRDEVAALRG